MLSFGRTLPISQISTPGRFKQNYIYWRNCADSELVKRTIEIGDSLEILDAKIGGSLDLSVIENRTRMSKLSWIKHNPDTKFLFDFLIDKIDRVNYHHYGMALFGMEELQYSRYPIGGHYEFHNDIIVNNDNMRKLSIVLALTDESEYLGGEFLLMPNGQNPEVFRFRAGDLIAFPSWIPHKVNPVTEGNRTTLVTWVYGPHFV